VKGNDLAGAGAACLVRADVAEKRELRMREGRGGSEGKENGCEVFGIHCFSG
jgi:hypothetical protein